jgi:PAS domain S-box-containing protein
MNSENEGLFRIIFNSTPNFVGLLDLKGNLIEINTTALSFINIDRNSVIGMPLWETPWWPDSEDIKNRIKRDVMSAASGINIEYEIDLPSLDGTFLTILFSLTPIRDSNGNVEFILPVGRPINDVVAVRNRYKAVVEGTNVGTWEWNVQTNMAIFDERWAGIIGYSLSEIERGNIRSWIDRTHPDDKAEAHRKLQSCFDGTSSHFDMKHRLRHKDGHWVWIQNRGKVFTWSDAGKPLLMYGTHEDITEKNRLKDELAISERAFRGNFENAAIGMAILDAQGRWLEVNNRVCEIVGYTSEELKRLTFQDITHPDDLEADLQLLTELIDGMRSHYQMEKRYIRKDGEIVSIILAASVVRDQFGGILYFISQIIDINDLKKAQIELKMALASNSELLEFSMDQNQRLSNFAYIVSHNIKSQTAGISMLIASFLNDHPELSDIDDLKMLGISINHLGSTVSDLSKVVKDNVLTRNELVSVNLRAEVDKVFQSFDKIAKAAQVQLINDVTEMTRVLVLPPYLVSVITNMVTNSIKYRTSHIDSYLKISSKLDDRMVVVSFEDNGIGIDMHKHGESVFEKYMTVDPRPDSQGIGLFITKNQVEAMGGTIHLESVPNEGTVFYVSLLEG